MNRKRVASGLGLIAFTIVAFLPDAGAALEVYPAKGQTPEQQATDKAACQQWAKSQTGFDPESAMQNQPQTAPPPPALRARKRAREEEQQLQAQSKQQEALKQKMSAYEEAESVCLKGRGYSVG